MIDECCRNNSVSVMHCDASKRFLSEFPAQPDYKLTSLAVILVNWLSWFTPSKCDNRTDMTRSVLCLGVVIEIVLVRYEVLFDTDRYLNFVRYSILDTYVASLIFK